MSEIYLNTEPMRGNPSRVLLVKQINAMTGSGGAGVGVVLTGSGSPEGVVAAPPGSIYTDITGGIVIAQYTKQTGVGNTGWV